MIRAERHITVETLICHAIFAVLGSQATLWRVKMRTLVPGQGATRFTLEERVFAHFHWFLRMACNENSNVQRAPNARLYDTYRVKMAVDSFAWSFRRVVTRTHDAQTSDCVVSGFSIPLSKFISWLNG